MLVKTENGKIDSFLPNPAKEDRFRSVEVIFYENRNETALCSSILVDMAFSLYLLCIGFTSIIFPLIDLPGYTH